MKIWLPLCGDAIRLTSDWTFELHQEYRNNELWCVAFGGGPINPYSRPTPPPKSLMIPTSTELVFDRIYVRQGADDYASCTFVIKEHPDDKYVGQRFWAKLEDVNTIECDTTTTDNPVGPFAGAKFKFALKAKKDPSLIAKAAKTQQTKEELEAARTELEMLCSKTSSFTMTKPALFNHIALIVKNVVDDLQASFTPSSWNKAFSRTIYERDVRAIMNHCEWLDRTPKRWVVVSTRKNKDGSTSRDFSFAHIKDLNVYHSEEKYDGFTVISQGTKVIDIVEFFYNTP